MNTKKAIMLGVTFAGIVGVAGVAVAGQNGFGPDGLKASLAVAKNITLDAEDHANLTDLETNVDNDPAFPWKDIGDGWSGGYIGAQDSQSRINFEYWTDENCTYDFAAADCFVEGAVGHRTYKEKNVCEIIEEEDPETGEINEYPECNWEEVEPEEIEEGDEIRDATDAAHFWFFIGLNNIQSFTINYSFSDPSKVQYGNISYEFMDHTIVGDTCGLSGNFSANNSSFTLNSTSTASATCRYLRFSFWATDVTFKITSLTVSYIC